MPIRDSQQLRCSTGLRVMCTARGGAWEGFLMFQRMPPATRLRQIPEGVSAEIFCESSGRPGRDLGTLQQGPHGIMPSIPGANATTTQVNATITQWASREFGGIANGPIGYGRECPAL